jgi:hypothetical protein
MTSISCEECIKVAAWQSAKGHLPEDRCACPTGVGLRLGSARDCASPFGGANVKRASLVSEPPDYRGLPHGIRDSAHMSAPTLPPPNFCLKKGASIKASRMPAITN